MSRKKLRKTQYLQELILKNSKIGVDKRFWRVYNALHKGNGVFEFFSKASFSFGSNFI